MSGPAPQGPFLYDDAPEPLHTGRPQRRNWSILLMVAGTVLLAIAAVVALPLVKGSPEKQARQAAGVFVAALAQGDTETAYQLLCDAERARLTPDQMIAEYRHPGSGTVLGATSGRANGDPAEVVTVRWTGDGRTARLTVINESGPHVCGTATG